MTHLRYSKTTRREKESRRNKREEQYGRACELVCVSLCAHALLGTHKGVHECFCVLAKTHHVKTVQMSMLWLVSHAVKQVSKRRDFPSLFQISQAVQMGTDMPSKINK